MLEVKADDVVLRLDGKILALKGLSSQEDYSKGNGDNLILSDSEKVIKLVEKNIPTEKKLSFKEFIEQQKKLNN